MAAVAFPILKPRMGLGEGLSFCHWVDPFAEFMGYVRASGLNPHLSRHLLLVIKGNAPILE